jgi:hypothetical protein
VKIRVCGHVIDGTKDIDLNAPLSDKVANCPHVFSHFEEIRLRYDLKVQAMVCKLCSSYYDFKRPG